MTPTNSGAVLAVLDRAIRKQEALHAAAAHYNDASQRYEDDLREARLAVAELIAAADDGSRNDRPVGFTLYFDEVQAERLIAALARVGGAK